MTEEERVFVRDINVDKAKKKTIICFAASIISIATYIIPLTFGKFDFGLVFEIISFIFLLIARHFMSEYDEGRSKTCIIISMIPIGWLFIYDLISVISAISSEIDILLAARFIIFEEFFTIINLVVLYAIIKDLSKADNPEKYKESTDWFYERMDKDKQK